MLQDADGQTRIGHSVAAGLDYPGTGPQHSWLKDHDRAQYVSVTDEQALAAFQLCAEVEGIIPALESSHAVAYLVQVGSDIPPDDIVILNMSGRGDKDVYEVMDKLGLDPQ